MDGPQLPGTSRSAIAPILAVPLGLQQAVAAAVSIVSTRRQRVPSEVIGQS